MAAHYLGKIGERVRFPHRAFMTDQEKRNAEARERINAMGLTMADYEEAWSRCPNPIWPDDDYYGERMLNFEFMVPDAALTAMVDCDKGRIIATIWATVSSGLGRPAKVGMEAYVDFYDNDKKHTRFEFVGNIYECLDFCNKKSDELS